MGAPDHAITAVQALSEMAGAEASPRLLAHADLATRWRRSVRHALADYHLVMVANELLSLGWHTDQFEELGIPVDLLDCFPNWRAGSRLPFIAAPSGLRLAPSGAALPLGTLRLQLSPTPGTIPHALALLRDLLRQLDPAVRFVVIVEPGADLDALAALTARFHPSGPARVRFVHLRCISVFAQDNARAARDGDGRPVLLVPRAFRRGGVRAEDELDPADAERAFGMRVQRSRLYWEGGNLVHDDRQSFVGVDTIRENVSRLGLDEEEVRRLFEAELGLPVVPLGRYEQSKLDLTENRQVTSGQPSFHLDLDVALLGRVGAARRPRAIVADAARGLDFLDDVLRVRRLVEGHFLPARELRRHLRAEYEAFAETRHPLLLEYAEALDDWGYRVIGVPDLRIDPRMDVFQRVNLDLGYCNVLTGLRRSRPAVHYFPWGVPRLDADAARRIRLAGAEPVAVSTPDVASAMMMLSGGLHCCCGSL